jgi:hypothetical protein
MTRGGVSSWPGLAVDPDTSDPDLARHAAFFVAFVPVPLHFGHSSTMRSALVWLGT